MGDRTFQLIGKGSPAAAILLAAAGVLAFALLAGLAAAPGVPPTGRVAAVALGLLAAGGFLAWARNDLRRNRGPRRLTLSADRITIEHPDPLRAPLHLPRDLVRAIAVDASGDRRARLPVLRAFSWSAPTAAPDGVEHFLWTAEDGDTFLPVVGAPKDRPTVAIVLRHPAAFDAARAPRARGADARTGRTTLDRERHVLGLMLAVEDPTALAAALADWPEHVEALTTADFRPAPEDDRTTAHLRPAPEDDPATAAAAARPEATAIAPPLAAAPPLTTPPPPAPEPTLDDLDLPPARSVAATHRVALLVALGFALPFALLNAALLGLTLWLLVSDHVAWFWLPGGLTAGMLYAVLHREPTPEHGIPLTPADAPELHAFVADVAAQTGAPVPDAIRLTLPPQDSIAATRSGTTLHLGLPALSVHDRDGLRAIVAHELAHHARRHTAVGRVIRPTFVALDRLHGHLADLERTSRFWALPATALRAVVARYHAFAAPIAIALTRHHEIEADRIAAAAVGPAVAVAELERYYALSDAFDGWMDEVLVPALESGHRPPLAASFATYLERPEVRRRSEALVDAGRRVLTLDPRHSHPPLGVRLAIARSAAPGQTAHQARPRDRRPALALLDRLDLREQELLARFAGADRVATLQPVQAAA